MQLQLYFPRRVYWVRWAKLYTSNSCTIFRCGETCTSKPTCVLKGTDRANTECGLRQQWWRIVSRHLKGRFTVVWPSLTRLVTIEPYVQGRNLAVRAKAMATWSDCSQCHFAVLLINCPWSNMMSLTEPANCGNKQEDKCRWTDRTVQLFIVHIQDCW